MPLLSSRSRMTAGVRLVTVALSLAFVSAAAAQTPLPGLDNFTLERPQPTPTPSPVPTPATPAPVATPTPAPTPTTSPSAAPTAGRTPTPSPTPAGTATPRATATPTPAAPSVVVPPAPLSSPTTDQTVSPSTPSPIVSPTPVPASETQTGFDWWWAIVPGVAVLALLAGLLWRRRRRDEDAPAEPAPQRAPGASTAAVPAAPPRPATPRPGGLVTSALKPDLRLELRPVRAGVDSLRATLEYDLKLVNAGRAPARGVTVEAWLLSASHDTISHLERIFASAIGEPMLAPFELANSATIDLSGVAVCPREALAVITAGERRMFVPVLAIRVSYQDTRGTPQVLTVAHLVGIEREGQERLAPLPLDRGSRMHERLAARRHGS